MIKKLVASLVLTAGLVAGGQIADIYQEPACPDESKFYIGAGLAYDELYLDGYEDWTEDGPFNVSNPGIQLTAGYTLFGYDAWKLSAEGRLGYVDLGNGIEYTWYGIYAKPEYDIGKFGIYGLLGYGTSDVTVSFYDYPVDVSVNGTVSDFTYGLGVSYDIDEAWQVVLDYVVEPEFREDDINDDVITLGVNYKFRGL